MNYDWVYPEIGRLISRRRNQLELTQEQLAPQVELSRTSVANIERGRQKILVHQLLAFAHALNVEPLALLPQSKSPTPAKSDVKYPTDINARQRAQLARLLDDPPTTTRQGETDAKQTKR